MRITKEQARALVRIYRRAPMSESFLQFRRSAFHTIGCDGAIVIGWAGMFLCIERDGYAHS
jgi:hypothetical protein